MTRTFRTTREQLRPSEVDKIAALLAEGGIGIIPFDTVYGLIGRAFDEIVQERLDVIKGDRRLPYAVNYADFAELQAGLPAFDVVQLRFLRILLPGAVTFLIRTPDFLQDRFRYRAAGGLGVRISDSPIVRQICRQLGAPLWATSANPSSGKEPIQYSDLSPAFIKQVDLVVDGGPTQLRAASSVLDIRSYPYTIQRRGAWINRLENALVQFSGPVNILVVCAGNICRSPYAAARLQQELKDLPQPGAVVSSAGIQAVPGNPATKFMVDIAAGEGLDLSSHSSRPFNPDNADEYDLILTTEAAQRDYIIARIPALVERVQLLGEPVGYIDIPDPFGLEAIDYRQTAPIIADAVAGWAKIIRAKMPPLNSPDSSPG